jgi:hypothetical protein
MASDTRSQQGASSSRSYDDVLLGSLCRSTKKDVSVDTFSLLVYNINTSEYPPKGSSFFSKVVIPGEIPGFAGNDLLQARPLPIR